MANCFFDMRICKLDTGHASHAYITKLGGSEFYISICVSCLLLNNIADAPLIHSSVFVYLLYYIIIIIFYNQISIFIFPIIVGILFRRLACFASIRKWVGTP